MAHYRPKLVKTLPQKQVWSNERTLSRLTTTHITIDERLRSCEKVRLEDLLPVPVFSLDFFIKKIHVSDRVAAQIVSLGLEREFYIVNEVGVNAFFGSKSPSNSPV